MRIAFLISICLVSASLSCVRTVEVPVNAALPEGPDESARRQVDAASQPVDDGPVATREEVRASVVVNEICYSPRSGEPNEEWIELYNRSGMRADVSGWRLGGSVEIELPRGTSIPADGFLLVAADAARIRERVAASEVVGGWSGELDDAGGEIHLVDRDGSTVESLAYAGGAPWPTIGAGRSLERRSASRRADDVRNWSASGGGGWVRVTGEGIVTSQRFYFYLLGSGACVVDDFVLRDAAGKVVLRDDFSRGRSWRPYGGHRASRIDPSAGRGGTPGMRVVAEGAGSSGSSAVDRRDLPVTAGSRCRVEFWARFEADSGALVARFSGAGNRRDSIWIETVPSEGTPGARNSTATEVLPGLVESVRHEPFRPGPGEPVTITARVRPGDVAFESLILHVARDGGAVERVPLETQTAVTPEFGARSLPVDFAASLPGVAAETLVEYWVTATDAREQITRFPEGELGSRRGYFVEPPRAPSAVPVYRLRVAPEVARDLRRNPHSDAYRPATFIYDGVVYSGVGVRHRGHTSRAYPKRHWKLKFPKANRFRLGRGRRPIRTVNLNSSYGDKIALREMLGFRLWRDLGRPHCAVEHVVLELNGEFYGLYVQVENPGETYLTRNGQSGHLWKAYSSANGRGGRFELEAGDPATARDLLVAWLDEIRRVSGEELDALIEETIAVDSFLDFLVANQLIHNADHVEKNYLVHRSPDGRFTFLPWDLDLTHGRNFECRGWGGILNDRLRYNHWDDETNDDALLFGTRVHPKCDGPVNGVIDAVLRRTNSFRRRYYRRLAEALSHYYDPAVLLPKARALRDRIRPLMLRDRALWRSYGGDDDFDRRFAAFEDWVRKRYRHLDAKLTALGYEVPPALNAWFDVGTASGAAPVAVRFRDRSVGEIVAWRWTFGDGGTSEEQNPRHIYRDPGRYDVHLQVTARDGRTHAWVLPGAVFVDSESPASKSGE